MNVIIIRKLFNEIRRHTMLIQGISIIFTDQMPTSFVFRKVYSIRASKFSTVYDLEWQSSQMKRQNLKEPQLNNYIRNPLTLYVNFLCAKMIYNIFVKCLWYFTLYICVSVFMTSSTSDCLHVTLMDPRNVCVCVCVCMCVCFRSFSY